jgi:hypothetical protein
LKIIYILGIEIQGNRAIKKSNRANSEANMNLKIFAQHKALRENNVGEYQRFENCEENELKKHLFGQLHNETGDQLNKQKQDNGSVLDEGSDADGSNIGGSVLEEYWEDFEIDK